VVGAVVGAAVLLAPSAAADQGEYLDKLQHKYKFLTTQQLLAEGNRVCAAEQAGLLSPAKTRMVMNDLVISTTAALDIVSAAEWDLC
jgi:hypothetical protein